MRFNSRAAATRTNIAETHCSELRRGEDSEVLAAPAHQVRDLALPLGEFGERAGLEVEGDLPSTHPLGLDPMLRRPVAHRLIVTRLDPRQVDVDPGDLLDAGEQPREQHIAGRAVRAGEEQHPILRLQPGGLVVVFR